jgi:hypothetical protein
MIGAAAMTRNIRRTGIPATKKGKPNPEYARSVIDGLPTAERLAKSEGFYHVGDDQQGTKIVRMRDDTLERLLARQILSGVEYAALQKYHLHWHRAGLEAAIGSVDLNRIFSSDPGSMSGMAKTEGQAHHRHQWREARELIGHRAGIVVDNVVCAGWNLETAGHSIGFASPYRARQAARDMLKYAGYRLSRLWGIG